MENEEKKLEKRRNLSISGLVISCCSILFSIVLVFVIVSSKATYAWSLCLLNAAISVVGIVLCAVGMKNNKRFGIPGIVLAIIGIGLAFIVLLIFFIFLIFVYLVK